MYGDAKIATLETKRGWQAIVHVNDNEVYRTETGLSQSEALRKGANWLAQHATTLLEAPLLVFVD